MKLSHLSEFLDKTGNYYTPSAGCSIRWDSPMLAIDWELIEPHNYPPRTRQEAC